MQSITQRWIGSAILTVGMARIGEAGIVTHNQIKRRRKVMPARARGEARHADAATAAPAPRLGLLLAPLASGGGGPAVYAPGRATVP